MIGIVGEDPFGTILDDAVREELAQDAVPLSFSDSSGDETLAKCDILFIARSEKDRLKGVLDQVRSQAILTVADTAGAAEQGVMINLSLVQGSVKMEINRTR